MRGLFLASRPIFSFSFRISQAAADSRGLKLMLQRSQWNHDMKGNIEEPERQEGHTARASSLSHGVFITIHPGWKEKPGPDERGIRGPAGR
jgi:hypothetical protein